MALPADGPATLGNVKTHLGIAAEDSTDDDLIQESVDAVNAKVRTWRCSSVGEDRPDWDHPEAAAVVRGSTMLAARLHRRKDTPDGVTAFAGDAPVYVQRQDPDVAMLLGLGAHSKPVAR